MKDHKKIKKVDQDLRSYLDGQFTQIEKRFSNLEKAIDKRFDRLFVYLDYRFKPLEDMAKDYNQFKHFVTDKLSWLVDSYKKFNDEYIVASEQHFRLSSKVDNHEERITELEKKRSSKAN